MKQSKFQVQEVYSILQFIDDKITESDIENYIQDVSLYSGLSGISLFQIYYQRYLNRKNDIREFSKQKINLLISIYENNYEKYKGLTSIFQFVELALFLIHLNDIGLLSKDSLYILIDEESDSYVFEAVVFHLENGFIDFLDGASGLGYYLLRRYETDKKQEKILSYLNSIVEIVESISVKASYPLSGLYWKSFGILDKSWGINLGMAHGIPSLVSLLIKYYTYVNLKNKERIYNLVTGVINFMESIRYSENKTTFFPGYMKFDFSIHPKSTFLAWCYGDAPMAKLYKNISSVFPEFSTYSKIADKILEKAFNRNLSGEILTQNIGLCHGAAGAIMMYNTQVHQKCIEKNIIRDINFWMNNLIQLLCSVRSEKSTLNLEEFNFLNGIAGAGLSLLECLDKRYSQWKEFFLYN